MNADLRKLFERVQAWPESDQAELAELAELIEVRHRGEYRADRSGVASKRDVEAVFKTFRG
jgi:hypothetical protein